MVGSSTAIDRQGFRIVGIGDRLADVDVFETGQRDNFAHAGAVSLYALQTFENIKLFHSGFLDGAFVPGDHDFLIARDLAGEDSADRQPPDVLVVVDICDQQLQRVIAQRMRRRNRFDDLIEQRFEICRSIVKLLFRHAVARNGIKNRKLNLLVGRIEIHEQLVNLVHDFFGARVVAVDLVDDRDRRQSGFQSFAQNKARLRQAAFGRVHQQHHAVDHLQNAFDFAAEIGVSRRVDDIDFVIAVTHGSVLGHDGDAAFALEIHRVHDAIDDGFVVTIGAGLLEHGID